MMELFDKSFVPTPEQRELIDRLDRIVLTELEIKNCKPFQVLQLIQARLVAAGCSDVRITWGLALEFTPSLHSYSSTEMRLATALYYLRGPALPDLQYRLQGQEIIALLPPSR